IRPANVQPDVVLEGAELQKGTNSANELAISFNNRGTARAALKNLKLHLTGQGKTIDLQAEQLKEINNAVILAGNKRRFVMPWPNNMPVGAVTAKFESE
ncbi:MAG: fimbrial biogenesis chaperone, partial [Nostoc sp.]